MSNISEERARELFPSDVIEEEKRQIQAAFNSMKFAERIRQTAIACNRKCGGKTLYPFRMDPAHLIGTQEVCFGDCLNINFEKGPMLSVLGEVPEDAIPKKFIWAHSL